MNARSIRYAGAAAASLAVALPALAGCGGSSSGAQSAAASTRPAAATLPQSSEPSHLNPAEFTTRIDNPYWPMPVGARWRIRVRNGAGQTQDEIITVTKRTKRIADGVTARVVHDVVSEHGRPTEITDDWYAQDRAGNIWYFGENTGEIHNGKRDTSGSFEAGRHGADAGVAMPAVPRTGQTYREEYYKGHAEDRSKILSLAEQAGVPAGHFTKVLLARDSSPIEADVDELKFYAKGVGPVLAVTVSGGTEREELVSATK